MNIMYCTCLLYYRPKTKFAPLQVKNKPCDRETEHAFILGSLDCTATHTFLLLNRGQVMYVLGEGQNLTFHNIYSNIWHFPLSDAVPPLQLVIRFDYGGNSSWLGPTLPFILLSMKSEDMGQGSALPIRQTWSYWGGGAPVLLKLIWSWFDLQQSKLTICFYVVSPGWSVLPSTWTVLAPSTPQRSSLVSFVSFTWMGVGKKPQMNRISKIHRWDLKIQILERHILGRHFLKWTYPRRTFPRKDISQTGHILDWTYVLFPTRLHVHQRMNANGTSTKWFIFLKQ